MSRPVWPRLTRGYGALAVVLAMGCRRAPPPPVPLVEPSACSAVLRGPICEVDGARTIRLRVRAAPDAALAVTVDADPPRVIAVPRAVDLDEGVLVPVELPEGARAVIVAASKGGASSVYRLPIVRRPAFPALVEALRLRAAGKPAEAEVQLRGLLADGDPFARQLGTRALARVERDLGRKDDAARRFREAIALDQQAGRVSDEVDDRLALMYALVYDSRRFEEARGLFPPLEPLVGGYPDGGARAPYFLGLIEYETGNLRAALRLFRESAVASARIGLSDQRLDALTALADTLAILGRSGEAAERLREAEAALSPDAPPCRRAELLNNTGWTALRAPLTGLPDPVEPLQRAVAIYRSACPARSARANALTNLALAEIDRGDVGVARAVLAEARDADPAAGPRIQVVWRSIEARLSLAEGQTEAALQLYEEVAALGDRALLPEARLEGALGRAEALDALGRTGAAREAYEDASRKLDAWSRLVPIGEGRDTFFARYERSARARVDFLVRTASPAEAAEVARQSRARALAALAWIDRPGALALDRRGPWEQALVDYRRARAALDARAGADAWLPADRQAAAIEARRAELVALQATLDRALAELGPALPAAGAGALEAPLVGELLLVYHPLREGWACFAVTSEGAVVHRLGSVDPRAAPAEIAARLLGPVKGALERAGRVRIAAYGELDRVDFHALPWEGHPLIERLPVAYGLDLPPSAPAIAAAHRALVVADPLEDLPSARREAGEVAAALEQAGWRVTRLEGRAATHAAVAAALEVPGVALLHYAGHATVEGRDGWETGLPLAAGGRFTVGDVIALARVPERVVLSGCDTARVQETARAEGLGLAQAFAIAGARAIIASTQPVHDQLARSLMAALYRSLLGRPGTLDLAAALRDAERDIAASSGFRAIVR